MNPNEIEVLIHCHYSREEHPRVHAAAVSGALSMWQEKGCIEPNDYIKDRYRITERGRAHIAQICNLPLPLSRKVWVTSEGKEIGREFSSPS